MPTSYTLCTASSFLVPHGHGYLTPELFKKIGFFQTRTAVLTRICLPATSWHFQITSIVTEIKWSTMLKKNARINLFMVLASYKGCSWTWIKQREFRWARFPPRKTHGKTPTKFNEQCIRSQLNIFMCMYVSS